MTKDEMVAAAKEAAPQIDAGEAATRIEAGALALDVREGDEFMQGRIPGAVHIPRGVLEFKLDHPALVDPSKPIVVYCKAGGRGALAAQTLTRLGFADVCNLAGGFAGWVDAGRASEQNPEIC